MAPGAIVDVTPAWPYRLPRRGGPDGASRVIDGVWERFLHVEGSPVLLRAWERSQGRVVRIAAIPVEPSWIEVATGSRGRVPVGEERCIPDPPRAGPAQLETGIARARHALGLDDDYGPFYDHFRDDGLLGHAIRRTPWLRVRRTAWPWEALAWAITEQLIEVERARAIQRRILARWGVAMLPPDRRRPLRDVPSAAALAARSPAELAACDLAPKRALALIKVAREVAAGRVDPGRVADDRRLTAISNVGSWTVQVLGQKGRGDPDALPAGDLAYLKLVPLLTGGDRRATIDEVERFYAPYAPFRGWAGLFTLSANGRRGASRKPLRYHPPRPEVEAA